MSLNVIVIQGRICTDLHLRYTINETPALSFRLANDQGYGEKKRTSFFSCVAYGSTAECINKYYQKGNMLLLNGRLQTSEYTDKQGQNRVETQIMVERIHFTGSAQNAENDTSAAYAPNAGVTTKAYETRVSFIDASDFKDYDDDGPLPWEE